MTRSKATPQRIRRLQDRAKELRAEYLRAAGWTMTCDVPGALWLWRGTLPDGRAVLCDEHTAGMLQQNIDPADEDDED